MVDPAERVGAVHQRGARVGPGGHARWLRRFVGFFTTKHRVAAELLAHSDPSDPVFEDSRARVLADPYDQRGLAPGDVLIARQTDPAWTPLFVDAAAVVVDHGSPMSHAVIVGRELDTICVVSAENASLRIPDGATVLVDGTEGTVTVL